MKVGLFGGTFDPIHIGHLIIADSAREAGRLDRVVFIPAARPPHKTNEVITPFEHRYAMVQLAVTGRPGFEVSDLEAREPGLSFTADTVSAYHHQHPDDELFLILGADSLVNLPTWKQPDRLVQLARFIVYPRQGFDPRDARSDFRENSRFLSDPLVDVSSSWIRDGLRQGRSVRYWLPPGVYDYLTTHHLG